MSVIPVVRVLLEDLTGRALYVRRAPGEFAAGKWCLPGGKVDEGQTHWDAIVQELSEEVGFVFQRQGQTAHLMGGAHYLFSQPPAEANTRWYREDFFWISGYSSPSLYRLGSECDDSVLMTAEEAIHRSDIAFSNAMAHLLCNTQQRERVTRTDWMIADIHFQLTGKLPQLTAYIPFHHAITQPDELQRWIEDTYGPVDPVAQQQYELVKEYSRSRLSRWMHRHGLE